MVLKKINKCDFGIAFSLCLCYNRIRVLITIIRLF